MNENWNQLVEQVTHKKSKLECTFLKQLKALRQSIHLALKSSVIEGIRL